MKTEEPKISKEQFIQKWQYGYSAPGQGSDYEDDLEQVISEAVRDHEAGKTVIKAKALRQKGTGEWYKWNSHSAKFSTSNIPTVLKQDELMYFYPAHSELIDIEIIVPAPYQEREGGEG